MHRFEGLHFKVGRTGWGQGAFNDICFYCLNFMITLLPWIFYPFVRLIRFWRTPA